MKWTKYYFLSIFLTCSNLFIGPAIAANIILESNEQNCKKINGWASDARELIASKLKTSVSSITFLRPKYDYLCYVIADTPQGPYKCYVQTILSSDKGKTAFANIELTLTNGTVSCDPAR